MTADPDKIDIVDIFTIGLLMTGLSLKILIGLCVRGPHSVTTENRSEYIEVSITENTINITIVRLYVLCILNSIIMSLE